MGQPLAGRPARVRRAPGRRPGRARRRSGRTARGRRRGAGRPSAASRRRGPRDGGGSPRRGQRRRAGSGRASAPTGPASCITPRPWVKRECSAVGKTQRALWSWLIRRSRWSQAVSSRSSSATSSSGRPAAARLGRRQPLGQLDVAVDRVADQVDRAERMARASGSGSRGVARGGPARGWRRRRPGAPPARGPRRRRPTTGSRGGSRSCPTTVARQRSEPSALGLDRLRSGASVASRTRLATFGAKRSTTSTGVLVRDDVPGPLEASDVDRRRVRRLERPRRAARRPGSARS